MKRKMTLLALAGKCGRRGASGFGEEAGALADTWAKKASSSRPASARPVKPAPASQRNSRRVRPQKLCFGWGITSLPRLFPYAAEARCAHLGAWGTHSIQE